MFQLCAKTDRHESKRNTNLGVPSPFPSTSRYFKVSREVHLSLSTN